jgi:hypothetical protein
MFRTASGSADTVLVLISFPFIVWGAEELRRWAIRK